MGSRGKESAAGLAVVPIGALARLEPPAELTGAQAELWRRIVETKPAEWFTADSASLLVAYCRAITDAEVINSTIEAYPVAEAATADGLKQYAKLLTVRKENALLQAKLATSMRLTQQSRYQAKSAATAADRTATGTKPWQRRAQ